MGSLDKVKSEPILAQMFYVSFVLQYYYRLLLSICICDGQISQIIERITT